MTCHVAPSIHKQQRWYQRTNLVLKQSHKLVTTEAKPEGKAHEHSKWCVSGEQACLSSPAKKARKCPLNGQVPHITTSEKMHLSQGYVFSSRAQLPQSEPGTHHSEGCTKTFSTLLMLRRAFRKLTSNKLTGGNR